MIKVPHVIKTLSGCQISDMSCGSNHAIAWSRTTQIVYSWGSGSNGRLGNDSEDIVAEPQIVPSFKIAAELGLMTIKQVACGDNHNLALVGMLEEEKADSNEGKSH